jgi:hypothetical protein
MNDFTSSYVTYLPTSSLIGKDMSGMIAANADFSKVRFKDAQISK